jgi:hypothetical protein
MVHIILHYVGRRCVHGKSLFRKAYHKICMYKSDQGEWDIVIQRQLHLTMMEETTQSLLLPSEGRTVRFDDSTVYTNQSEYSMKYPDANDVITGNGYGSRMVIAVNKYSTIYHQVLDLLHLGFVLQEEYILLRVYSCFPKKIIFTIYIQIK